MLLCVSQLRGIIGRTFTPERDRGKTASTGRILELGNQKIAPVTSKGPTPTLADEDVGFVLLLLLLFLLLRHYGGCIHHQAETPKIWIGQFSLQCECQRKHRNQSLPSVGRLPLQPSLVCIFARWVAPPKPLFHSTRTTKFFFQHNVKKNDK